MIERRGKRKKKKQEFREGLDSIQKMEMEKPKVTIQGLGREKKKKQEPDARDLPPSLYRHANSCAETVKPQPGLFGV